MWKRMRARFLRRLEAVLALAAIMVVGLAIVVVWIAGHVGGWAGFPHPWARRVGAPIVVLFVFGLVAAMRAFRHITAPIGDLMEGTARVAEGEYAVRVPERGPAETRSLARAFNRMAEHLQRQDAQRRSLLADVSHELRTPLTVIQGSVEGLLDGVYERDDAHLRAILDETHVLARLIEDLRTLAVTDDAGLRLVRVPANLGDLVRETLVSFTSRADAGRVRLSEDLASLPPIVMDVERIRQVLSNLIDNALRFTPPGGTIEVGAARVDGEVAVSVTDTGSGISADDLPHVFDRFYKSRDSGGAGLGLAVAKGLVEAHGGVIAAASTPGGGTRIRFTLPLGQN